MEAGTSPGVQTGMPGDEPVVGDEVGPALTLPAPAFEGWGIPNGPTVMSGYPGCMCALDRMGQVVCWVDGPTPSGATCDMGLPAADRYTSLSCMRDQCTAIRTDGSVVTAGYKTFSTRVVDVEDAEEHIVSVPRRYDYTYDRAVEGPFVRVDDNGQAACALTADGDARCWWPSFARMYIPCLVGGIETTNCTTYTNTVVAMDPPPPDKYFQLRPGGCAIRASDRAIINVPELRPDLNLVSPLPGPAGRYNQILRCVVTMEDGGERGTLDDRPIMRGRALREDGRIVDFWNDHFVAAEYMSKRYTMAADTGSLTCGLLENGKAECSTRFVDEPIAGNNFKLLAAAFGGIMYGVSDELRIMAVQGETGGAVPSTLLE